ncbi:YbgC/FadM family acyl-CoA thioesterase [Legionella sp. MW5194]|uniref:YbgC/FadM family acyl-CoA thioesterase n=1 Tax=Legionella sp. MW5194 TaxID=2662448 RepID=UPI001EF00702|nr:YbgC/FadM family acyl-CoA thioesterase [Legionella sp. MW5194]
MSYQSSFRVYAEDTDMMGIVYHANFLCFFERARTEMLREKNWSLTRMAAEHDRHFVISDVSMQFLHPAMLDDLLFISSDIVKRSSCSILFEQSLRNQHNTLLCEAQVKIVCVDSAMKIQRIPPLYNEEEVDK